MNSSKLKSRLLIAPLLIIIFFIGCSPKLYKTGQDFAASGKHDDAIAQFTKLLEEDPENTDAYIARAKSYEKVDKKAEAADDYKRAAVF